MPKTDKVENKDQKIEKALIFREPTRWPGGAGRRVGGR